MLFRTAADSRPFHLGTYPLESLPRDAALAQAETGRPALDAPVPGPAPEGPLAKTARHYRGLFAALAQGEVAPKKAPVPDDLERRAIDIKGFGYFMDAAQVGICAMPEGAWLNGAEPADHGFAVVVLVEHGRLPEPGNLARDWLGPAVEEIADMRAAEIAVCVARHIRQMGFAALAHCVGESQADIERLAVLAGVKSLYRNERV